MLVLRFYKESSMAQKIRIAGFDYDGTKGRHDPLGMIAARALHDAGHVTLPHDPHSVRRRVSHRQAPFQEQDQLFRDYYDGELLKGLKVRSFHHQLEETVRQFLPIRFVFSSLLQLALQQCGYKVGLLSHSPSYAIGLIAQELRYDFWQGTDYLADPDGRLNGERVVKAKLPALRQACVDFSTSMDESVAVGNTTGDLDMLEAVTFPIAMCPAPDLRETLHKSHHHIPVVIERTEGVYIMNLHTRSLLRLENILPTDVALVMRTLFASRYPHYLEC